MIPAFAHHVHWKKGPRTLRLKLRVGGIARHGGLLMSQDGSDIPIQELLKQGYPGIVLVAEVTGTSAKSLGVKSCEAVLQDGTTVAASVAPSESDTEGARAPVIRRVVPIRELMDLIAENFRSGKSDSSTQSVFLRVELSDGSSLETRRILLAPTVPAVQ